jgi:HK97 family phage prohead protease
MLRKTCILADFKLLEEGSGGLQGYGSTWDNLDLAGEIVVKGAFSKTLDRFKEAGFIALGHDWAGLPVATIADAHEDGKGLFVQGEFHSTDEAQKARTYVRERLERGKSVGLSIGYSVKDSERTKDALLLKELDLFEVSIVTVPCNPLANATAVKGAKAVYLGEYAAEQMTLAALRNCYDSLFYSALYDILFDWNGTRTVDEKITEATAALDEARSLCVTALSAMMSAASDDDAKADLEAEYKAVFSVPALAAGRLNEQLDAALAATKSVTDRYERYAEKRGEDGRLPSPDRRAQLMAIHGAIGALIEKTAPAPELDLDLIREISVARKRRICRAIGASPA